MADFKNLLAAFLIILTAFFIRIADIKNQNSSLEAAALNGEKKHEAHYGITLEDAAKELFSRAEDKK